jgi:hypothetical protein
MDHRVREPVDDLATVSPVAGARGPIGSEEHATSVVSAGGFALCRTAQWAQSVSRALEHRSL